MISTRDDRATGEEERSEAKADFGGLVETAETTDHGEQQGGGQRLGGVRRWNKLSKREAEEVKRCRGDERCDGSRAKDGSRGIDLSPLWLPSGRVCVWVCVFQLA